MIDDPRQLGFAQASSIAILQKTLGQRYSMQAHDRILYADGVGCQWRIEALASQGRFRYQPRFSISRTCPP
jgi:hypothetical protein